MKISGYTLVPRYLWDMPWYLDTYGIYPETIETDT